VRALLFIAGRQLWDRRGLFGIAVAGVVLGVTSLIALTGIMRGMQVRFLATILEVSPHVIVLDTTLGQPRPIVDRLLDPTASRGPSLTRIIRPRDTTRQRRIDRPTETTHAIAQLEGVTAVAAVVIGSAVVSAGTKELPVELRGIDAVAQDRVTPLRAKLVAGSLVEFAGSGDGVLVGRALADLLGVGLGDSLGCGSASGAQARLRVVGVFETGVLVLDKTRIYVPTRLAQTILGHGDTIDRLELRLTDPARAPEVTTRIEALFGYDAEAWQETNASMLSVFTQQNMITGMIIGAVLVVGGFGILAIQIMIVLEKRRDIALLKSVGYTAGDVLTIFLVEGGVVAVIGAAIGAGAGHLALLAASQMTTTGMGGTRASGFAIWEAPILYVLAVTFAVAIGLLASLVPAWRAARVEPIDVLRGT
jgi:lipoprotein-releasing system permease protein